MASMEHGYRLEIDPVGWRDVFVGECDFIYKNEATVELCIEEETHIVMMACKAMWLKRQEIRRGLEKEDGCAESHLTSATKTQGGNAITDECLCTEGEEPREQASSTEGSLRRLEATGHLRTQDRILRAQMSLLLDECLPFRQRVIRMANAATHSQ